MRITLLRAEITVQPGWAVGAVPIGNHTLNTELLLDADGRPWVPGSSLAGSLRAHLRATDRTRGVAGSAGMETALMGSRPPKHPTDDADASRLWLLGTGFVPNDGGETQTEIVCQTRIDRRRGAATATSLRTSRSVASGGTLTAYLRYDGIFTSDELAAIATWQPMIGHGRTTGNGHATLVAIRYGTIDPAEPDGARIWLTHTGPQLVDEVVRAGSPIPIPARAREPWMIRDLVVEDALLVGGSQALGPATPRVRGGSFLVPGSAWKGVIRSRVEYILRSRYGETAACSGGLRPDGSGCGTCPTCKVFGHQGRRGLLAFADSTIDAAEQPCPRTQVAIDRITGGARDGLLFASQPVTSGSLQLRIDALAPVEDWVRTAIDHVLQDLHDGLIGIGSRTTRGMGTLRLASPPPPPDPIVVPALEAAAQRPTEVTS